MKTVIRCATMEDTQRLITFLNQVDLGTDGIAETIDHFLIMEDQIGRMKATIGIEPFGHTGLLRSLVMNTYATEKDLLLLLDEILLLAKDKGIMDIFMATNKIAALKLVELLGFQQISNDQLPKVLFKSDHVQHILTVDNSVFLKLSI